MNENPYEDTTMTRRQLQIEQCLLAIIVRAQRIKNGERDNINWQMNELVRLAEQALNANESKKSKSDNNATTRL
jgi:hypothetical protein